MISEGPPIIEALPTALQQALDRTRGDEEELLICVKGEIRQALAVTNRRVLLLTESLATVVETQEWPLTAVTDVRFVGRTGSSELRWTASGVEARMNVPVYDTGKFERIADRLRRLTSANQRPATATATAASCPNCSFQLPTDAAWCPGCGTTVRDVCWGCGSPLESGWQYCARCGTQAAEPATVACPACGTAVGRGHGFCPACGSVARPVCENCDRPLRRAWRYCPDCGEESGPADSSGDLELEPRVPQQRKQEAPSPVLQLGSAAGAGADDGEALNEAGIAAYENEQLDEAISLFRRAIVRAPGQSRYYTNLGVAYAEKGNDFEAFAAYQRAVELDPAEVAAYLNLGDLYAERERYHEAREMWERVVEIAPDGEEAGEARERLARVDEL